MTEKTARTPLPEAVIPTLGDGVTVLGDAANPLQITINLENVTGNHAVGGNLTVGGAATVTGDIVAGGGFRQTIDPWTHEIEASQADRTMGFGDNSVRGGGWVAPRAGSVTATGVNLSGPITGATNVSVVFSVYKNGVKLHADYDLTVTRDGGEVKAFVAVAKDAHAFAAGDVLDVRYTSGATTDFESAWATLEVEC